MPAYPDLKDATISDIDPQTWTGSPVIPSPEPTVTDGSGLVLVKGKDYTITYENNVDAGINTAKAIITPVEGSLYSGTQTKTFTIKPNISDATIADIAKQKYDNGNEITPKPTITYNGQTLEEGTDYELSYSENKETGEATITIKGIGNFDGQTTTTFVIYDPDISKGEVVIEDISEDDLPNMPKPSKVTDKDGNELEEGKDYTIKEYENNDKPGTATIVIEGKGDYEGYSKEQTFTIKPSVSNASIEPSPIANQKYTGNEVKPDITVKYGDETLDPDTDYDISYKDNTDVGTATITITGKGDYAGTKEITFDIYDSNIDHTTVVMPEVDEDTLPAKPVPTSITTADGKELVEGQDYEIVSYDNNDKAGTASITIKGIGDYDGTTTVEFVIKPSVSKAEITIDDYDDANGYPAEPKPTKVVDENGKELVEGQDYEIVSYDNNDKPGTATITIKGKGDYSGTKTVEFVIKENIKDGTVTIDNYDASTGSGGVLPATPKPSKVVTADGTELVEGVDYQIKGYENNEELGTATIIIEGIGKYTGTITQEFAITADISGASVSDIEKQKYTGNPIEPDTTITYNGTELVEGIDYEIVWTNNTETGTAKGTATGIGKYTGTLPVEFVIYNPDLSKGSIEPIDEQTENDGQELKPSVVVKDADGNVLEEGKDYDVSYSDNKVPGTGKVIITGKGDYEGSISGEFVIKPQYPDLTDGSISDIEAQIHTGEPVTPSVEVKDKNGNVLVEGKDYEISYENNTDAGIDTAKVIIKGIGDYTGTIEQTFTIKPNINDATSSEIEAQTEDGSPKEPHPTITYDDKELVEGVDYDISWDNNVKPGEEAKIIITGKGDFAGTKEITFVIKPQYPDISEGVIEAIPEQIQETEGQAVEPKPTVQDKNGNVLVEGKDYEIVYDKNTEPGIANLVVKGIGNYTGELETTFIISEKSDGASWTRLAGGTALTTMKAIVNEGWTTTDWAIIATNNSYQDALSASGIAGLLNAPVFMTDSKSLSSVTKNLIINKKVKNILIVGGESAVSAQTEQQIKEIGTLDQVIRKGGGTAASTALEVYKYGQSLDDSWGKDAIVATSISFQDALSIAPYAYAKHAPIFLTDLKKTTVRSSVLTKINNDGFTRGIIVGGNSVVSETVDSQIPECVRLAGGSCYSTSTEIATFCLANGMEVTHMGVARGDAYQDALAGVALLGGKKNSIITLIDNNTKNSKTYNIQRVIVPNKNKIKSGYIFGGLGAVSEQVETLIRTQSTADSSTE